MPSTRSRDFSWDDPTELARAAEGRSGRGFLHAIAQGELPQAPLMAALDFALVEVGPGRAVFEGVVSEYHYNLIGTVHGGYAAAMLDSATGCAVYTTLEPGEQWTTLSLSVDYTRPLKAGTTARCVANVVRAGRRVALADGEMLDGEGRLCARAKSKCMLFRD